MLLLPTDAPTGRPAGVAGRLPSAQTVTQTRRLLRFGDTNTMDGRTTDAAIAVYKRAPLRVREQQAESRTQQTDFSLLFLTPPLSGAAPWSWKTSCRVGRLVLSLARSVQLNCIVAPSFLPSLLFNHLSLCLSLRLSLFLLIPSPPPPPPPTANSNSTL